MIFKNIEMCDRAEYEKFLCESGIISCAYSFLALWAWRGGEKTEVCFDEQYPICWLKNKKGFLSPICKISLDWQKIFAEKFPNGEIFHDVPQIFADEFCKIDGVRCEESRPEWEYIHSVQDLIELSGNKFHHKRTHIKNFEQKFSTKYQYLPLIPDDFDELKKFQAAWLARQEISQTLRDENDAIMEIFAAWDDFSLFGAIIKIDGKIAAYTIAEELSSEILDVRFEKAFSEYDGIYQALNKYFLARQGKSYKWVNREEDMGSEGLRQAKTSYNPVRFEKKFRVILKGA